VNERAALAIIERDHGSLEDFVIFLLSEKKDALSEDIPLVTRAEMVGLPVVVFARLLASPSFRSLLRVDLVNMAFTLQDELEHVRTVSRVAKGERRLVMSAKGDFGEVDQAPTDVIAAGKYLNDLRGTPIEKGASTGHSVIINIGRPEMPEANAQITIEADAVPYRAQRAGGLPPAGIRAGLGAPASRDAVPESRVDAGLGTLYGPSAEEADEDHALAEKQRVAKGVGDGSESDGDRAVRQGRPARGNAWSRAWPHRGKVPDRSLVARDD
jgi:hypothetical protein